MNTCQFVINILLALIPILSCTSVIDSPKKKAIFRIPLIRKQSGLEMLMEKGADMKLIEGILKMGSRKIKNPATNDTLPLYKYFDTQYYGIINIGKPGRAFNMIFDTAWSHSWVISVFCPLLSIPCALHNRYDHSVSSTYKRNGTKYEPSDTLKGFMSKDLFLVGQMNVTDQPFAEIMKLPWDFSLVKAVGVVGLGPQGGSPGFLPFFYNLFNQHILKQPFFSIYINRDPTTPHGGSILFGAIDKKHKKGEFTTINVTSKTSWSFQVDKVKVILSSKNFTEFCKNGCTAKADTSSNTIVGPPDDINQINSQIGTQGMIYNRAMIPCVMEFKGPKVNFTIANKEFQIFARDYVQKLSYSGVTLCLSAFVTEGDQKSNTWRIGGAFFYQFYTVFDIQNHKMMIAEAA